MNPLGIDTPKPRLSWQLWTARRNVRQRAWRVLLASSRDVLDQDRGDCWDSGRVKTEQTTDVPYGGTALCSRQARVWKVKVWDNHGIESGWSSPAHWEMGLLSQNDWQAGWIGHDEEPVAVLGKAPMFAPIYARHEFALDKAVSSARLYAAALGWYRFHINGQPVGRDFFTPGWTDYRYRIYYNTYDVTTLLKEGTNAIGSAMAGGWYNWPNGGEKPRVLGQLEVVFDDGSQMVVATDPNWRVSRGAERYAHILFGESYDARRAISGWDRPGFDETGWSMPDQGLNPGAHVVGRQPCPKEPALEAYPSEPVRVFREIKPLAVYKPVARDVYVFDMGTNYAGFVRIRVKGARRGQTIRLRFGDWINRDRTLYNENLRLAKHMMDQYVCAGEPEEIWEPRFTFRGHRYVEVTGWPYDEPPNEHSITGIELTQEAEQSLTFTSGSQMLNRLMGVLEQTRRANTLEAPTDCSQRNERQGWCGDANFFSKTANALADLRSFYRKWLRDVLDAQHVDGGFARLAPSNLGYYTADRDGMPGWASAGVLIPWLLWQYYGDRDILKRFYPAIQRHIEFRRSTLKNGLRNESSFYYGDWNSFDYYYGAELSEWGADTSIAYAAYVARTFHVAVAIARLLGHDRDVDRYQAYFEQVKSAFQQTYMEKAGMKHPTQGNCALALRCGLVEGRSAAQVASQLVQAFRERDWHPGVGIVSAPEILFALSEHGYTTEAYNVLLCDTFPSWGYMLQCSATAIWEHWASSRPELPSDASYFVPCSRHEKSGPDFERRISPEMNSANHPAFGGVGDWVFRNVAGINPAAPGFKRIRFQPRLDATVGHADTAFRSIYGVIRCAWWVYGHQASIYVEVPPNTSAEVWVSAEQIDDILVDPDARPVAIRDGWAVFEVSSGTYTFDSIALPMR